MASTAYSAEFKTTLVQQAIRTGASAEALAAAHEVPPDLVRQWLQQAMDAVPAVFAEPAAGSVMTLAPLPEQTFRIAFDTSPDAIMLLTDAGFFDCNPATLAIYGIDSMAEFIGIHPSKLSPPFQPDGRDSLEAANERIGEALRTGSAHFEWMHQRRNGENFEADVLIYRFEADGRTILQATVRDISRMKRLQNALATSHAELALAHAAVERQNRELALLCSTDQLTGLFNRRKLDEVIQTECHLAERHHRPVAMILADLDHFKDVNDTFGHQIGDKVLQQVAAVMQRTVRETDVVGRWGGEEFMVVCRGSDAQDAGSLADRLRLAIQRHSFDPAGSKTCSFGIAPFDSALGVDSMVREADNALYKAKVAGRNRVMVSRSRAGTDVPA
jgi:diguanylate cyclase (GGDEF)-like protein/PAS domain S-box-containing protein